ncbi:MAG: GAF domain-containing protein [Candidatus Thermoplasmatota archaeon]|nr:GAF domain-containing protein [Candidatus Thermoplasmatota archaeon]
MISDTEKESLLAVLSDGVFVCTKDGDILYSNPAFSSILGYAPDELKDKNIAKDLVERNLEWRAMISLLEQGSLVEDYEVKFRRADGGTVCASISASNLRDQQGVLIGIAVVLRDITTRKVFENELRDKAYRIDVMNKIAKASATEGDVRKKALVTISSELRKLMNFELLTLGITEENGRHVEVIASDSAEGTSAKSIGFVTYQGSIVEKLRFIGGPLIVGKDVGKRPFAEMTVMDTSGYSSMLCVPLASRGRIVGSLNIFHSKPNEYNIESSEFLQTVADQVAGLIDNMALLDSLGKKIKLQNALVNTGVELQKAITNQQIYAAIANSLHEVVYYTELSFYMVDWPKRTIYPVYASGNFTDEVMASAGSIDEGIVGNIAKSGKAEFTDDVDADPRVYGIPGIPDEHNSMLAIPLNGPEGVIGVLELYRPQGKVFTVSDLEAGKLFAQQASIALSNAQTMLKLQEAKKEIELLNDLMFHDINNFNFATLNYIQMIASGKDVPAEHKMYLEKSLHLIRQTAELIENVKKLTKIGVMNTQDFVLIDLSQVLKKIVSGLENSFPGRSISVNMNLPESCNVMANNLVEELFVNLLSNSVKYDPNQEIEIDILCERVIEDGKNVWKVAISDRGNGIPDDKKSTLFQKYVRLKPDPKISGSGLGLSICRALTDKFGGRIWVEDRVPGKSELGARFCVMLPAAKEAQ